MAHKVHLHANKRILYKIVRKPLVIKICMDSKNISLIYLNICRVRNLKFATYLKFATCENTNKINELW